MPNLLVNAAPVGAPQGGAPWYFSVMTLALKDHAHIVQRARPKG
jgi:hypothetical protein